MTEVPFSEEVAGADGDDVGYAGGVGREEGIPECARERVEVCNPPRHIEERRTQHRRCQPAAQAAATGGGGGAGEQRREEGEVVGPVPDDEARAAQASRMQHGRHHAAHRLRENGAVGKWAVAAAAAGLARG